MEEILASIRRIIADDDASKAATKPVPKPPEPAATVALPPEPLPPAPPPQAAANSQDEIDAMLAKLDIRAAEPPASDVFDLTEAMAAPASPESNVAATFRTIDASSDVVFTERPLDSPPEPALRIIDEPRRAAAPPPPPMPTPTTPAAAIEPDRPLISQATVAAVDSAFNSLAHTLIGQNACTLEDLVKEMLRPLLKSWLDDNLPGVVDRIVRAEIERVSRGR
jgi:cell pole-organizing protein PopZ